MSKGKKEEIICIGEVLWDSLPSGLFLGGAPLNVSLHLHNLEEQVSIVSRVGNDRLGIEALRRISGKGLLKDLVQTDEKFETGFVAVELDEEGTPDYLIKEPVAWDYIELSDLLLDRLKDAWGVVFGSLAQRNKTTRNTIRKLFECNCNKVFDINLRPPYISKQTIEESLFATDILKINESELHQLAEWFDLPGELEDSVRVLSQKFKCPIITVTKASNGAILLYEDEWFSHPGYHVKVADTVGAGDAFMSALLAGIKSGIKGQDIIEFANATGAHVASQNGAIPDYGCQSIEKMYNSDAIN